MKTLEAPATNNAHVATAAFGRPAQGEAERPCNESAFQHSTNAERMPTQTSRHPSPPLPRPKRFYASLWVQVSVAIVVAVVFGYLSPARAIAMKPLGDAFIRLITMIITLMIFCTVVTGIAGMQDMRKVGRVGGKALLYFEIVSTLALLIGLVVGNVVQPGSGFNVNPPRSTPRPSPIMPGRPRRRTSPTSCCTSFPPRSWMPSPKATSWKWSSSRSCSASPCRRRAARKPLVDLLESLTQAVFGMVNIVMRFAPIGAFGAMAFTIGKYGIASLGPLAN